MICVTNVYLFYTDKLYRLSDVALNLELSPWYVRDLLIQVHLYFEE